jgi:aminopeptidase N
VINDPPKEARHLRFVTPSETAGHIGPEGVYLSSETRWYPDMDGVLGQFDVVATVPHDWTVITQGRKERDLVKADRAVSSWTAAEPSEALTLVANKFVVTTRPWKGSEGQEVQLAAYLFPDNAALAEEYLSASAKYLDVYVPLLGPFPFEKFAVVENFFASGLGMPSFTLLGSGSIKRHYVQPYALGHEIVHSWIGNSVLNRQDRGNWVEGLTTYLANYYWHEWVQDEAQAREQRRLMIQAYSLYVPPGSDYPVARFVRKSDEQDNAIGYQKSAFVFHLLRKEIGEEAFWRGLKTLVSRFRTKPAEWATLEHLFTETSGRDLRWFFRQWVEEAGAPSVSLGEARAGRRTQDGKMGWHLTITIRQTGKPFRLRVPVAVTTEHGTETRWTSLDQPENRVEWFFAHQPHAVRIDPDLMAFLRMDRTELPPMLNGFVTDSARAVVRAFQAGSPLMQVAARLGDTEGQPRTGQTRMLSPHEPLPAEGSILVLAEADHRSMVQAMLSESCGEQVRLSEQGLQAGSRNFEGPGLAVLVSCRRAQAPGSVLSVLYGATPHSVAKVARLLFYYGWHSLVVFQEGTVVFRDVWEAQQSKEVHIVER